MRDLSWSILTCLALTLAGCHHPPSTTFNPDLGMADLAVTDSAVPQDLPDLPAIGDLGFPTDGPGATSTHALLFGGYDGKNPLGDTWSWDGASWTQLPIAGPPPRGSAIGGWVDGKVVVFGGLGLINDLGTNDLADTWTWDGASWSERRGPGPRARGLMEGGVLNGQLVFYGGYGPPEGGAFDVWSWDGQGWTERQADPGIGNLPLDAPSSEVGLPTTAFDGALFFTNGPRVWNWRNGWLPLPNDAGVLAGPSYRVGGAAATLGNKVVLFGGSDDGITGHGNNYFGETWLWDGVAWSQPPTPTAPSARAFPAMATVGDTVLLFGGGDDGGDNNETWTWNGSAWTQHTTPPALTARGSVVLVAY